MDDVSEAWLAANLLTTLLTGFQPLNPFSLSPLAALQKQKRVDSQPNLSFIDAVWFFHNRY
jgi:hypothetical protein